MHFFVCLLTRWWRTTFEQIVNQINHVSHVHYAVTIGIADSYRIRSRTALEEVVYQIDHVANVYGLIHIHVAADEVDQVPGLVGPSLCAPVVVGLHLPKVPVDVQCIDQMAANQAIIYCGKVGIKTCGGAQIKIVPDLIAQIDVLRAGPVELDYTRSRLSICR